MTRWYADLETNAYLGRPGSFMTADDQDWFNRQAKNQSMRNFGITVKESGALVGGVSLVHLSHLHQTAELAICIGERDARSRGYGTEAVRLTVQYGFGFLSLYSIYLWYASFNQRGHQAYIKAGFKEAGRIRGGNRLNGERYDSVLMEITRDDVSKNRVILDSLLF